MIHYDSRTDVFHLSNELVSYGFFLYRGLYPVHLYWGDRLSSIIPEHLYTPLIRSFSAYMGKDDFEFSLDFLPREFACFGHPDLRIPALEVLYPDGSSISNLTYKGHKILEGKPELQGLPATYVEKKEEASTLCLILRDDVWGLQVELLYTIYAKRRVITRSARYINRGKEPFYLKRALSMSIDFKESDFDGIHLPGSWGRERMIERSSLSQGLQVVESRRGASSHQHNPFFALADKDATEDYGRVFGFSLVYSGNFAACTEVDQYSNTRFTMGINPLDFSWRLSPGETFQTPEVVMVYSPEGLGDMSRTFHTLYRQRLCRGTYRDKERPVLLNNWEATYFDFDESSLLEIAEQASKVGVELFVLDDGWFGRRNDDGSSLGDWYVNQDKLPGGLAKLADSVKEKGLRFGLWFEPEMVSPDSDLYRKHPDWCIHVPHRARYESRRQLVLDIGRQEVREYIMSRMIRILDEVPVSYIKWDMNRHITESGSAGLPADRQRETSHRYMLGLYAMLEELTSRYPDILFESCSGGGGRFDPGLLYYMPQVWTSDNSDAVSRLKIQYGTSLVYPLITMGAHVSAVPNHQVGRWTPLTTRGHVAMSGNLGYELDLSQCSSRELACIQEQIAFYKKVRPLVQFGDFYRLCNPFEDNQAAWMMVSPDKKETLVFWCQMMAQANAAVRKIRLKGLDPSCQYCDELQNISYAGDELLNYGLLIPPVHKDFISRIWHFRAVS